MELTTSPIFQSAVYRTEAPQYLDLVNRICDPFIVEAKKCQEFASQGGGHHDTHIHWNNHISGFYFLKCSDKTSAPMFHDPRAGKMMTQLPEKDKNIVTLATEKVLLKPVPGTMMFFNSFLPHQFIVDNGVEPFRFIHFNLQAIPKNI